MDSNRLWQIGAALAAVGALALGWFFGVSPALDAKSSSDSQLATVQDTNATTSAEIAKLEAAKRQLPKLQSELDALLSSVPASDQTPAFVDQLDAAAQASGVAVTGIKISDAQQYKPATPPQGAAAPAATPAAGATPKPTVAPGMPPVTSPLITSKSLAVTPVDVTVTGSYAQSLAFVKAAQFGERLYLVTKIAVTPQAATGDAAAAMTTTLSGYIYTLTTGASPTPTAQ
jgi:Tfp pilus assembly protein PilO